VHFKNVDGVGELDVELEECDRELALRLALAIRLGIARVVWLNLARVDVRRSGAGAEGYHDLILDAGGGAAFVGEVKVRNISARNGAVFEPHYQAVLRGVRRWTRRQVQRPSSVFVYAQQAYRTRSGARFGRGRRAVAEFT
jgi:hypothetical protein